MMQRVISVDGAFGLDLSVNNFVLGLSLTCNGKNIQDKIGLARLNLGKALSSNPLNCLSTIRAACFGGNKDIFV